MRASLPLLIVVTALLAVPATADKKDKLQEARPPVFEALVNCRAIADPGERLVCYDAKVAAIDEAEKNDELVLADKQAMQDARRGLFGFSLPKIKLFGNADGEGEGRTCRQDRLCLSSKYGQIDDRLGGRRALGADRFPKPLPAAKKWNRSKNPSRSDGKLLCQY